MSLLSLNSVSHAYGSRPLLQDVNLTIQERERICLVGRNGAGKSTLMKIIEGLIVPDDGEVVRRSELRIGRLIQEVPTDLSGNVFDIVASALGKQGDMILNWHHAVQNGDMKAMEHWQHEIESNDAWALEQQVSTTLSKLSLNPETEFSRLSGGLKRRVLLAQSLVQKPDLLLLDEPTNHLDIESVLWLESFLRNASFSLLYITHDRDFLEALATRIIDIDRGQISSWPGSYQQYLKGKAELDHAEDQANQRFDKTLAEEEAWIRKGIKARRTRNEGRVRNLKAMREQSAARRKRTSSARLTAQEASNSGKIVVEAEHLSFAYGARHLVKDFSCIIQRGEKIALIGPNGSGKTTLVALLLQQQAIDSGTLKLGTNLEIAYFDQNRSALDDQKTVQENISPNSDNVDINGRPRHVLGYLSDFLFTPKRARSPVSALSGGEKNRLMLAKLFLKPFNLLVMDEPTNDLDMDTLEMLEDLLIDYKGTLLLVSHDRAFVDNVVDRCFVFTGNGKVEDFIGGYHDWIQYQQSRNRKAAKTSPPAASKSAQAKTTPKAKKLSYKLQRELEQLPAKIETLENQINTHMQALQEPGYYQREAAAISADKRQLEAWNSELEHAYARWEALEEGA